MNKTRLTISTPSGIFYQGEVEIVTLKTSEGYIGLQYNRLPFISSIEISPMYVKIDDNNKKEAAIGGGIVFVEKKYIDIFTDDIAWKEEINQSEVQKLIEQAHKKLEKSKEDNVERHKTELLLKKAFNKLNLINNK